MKKLLNTCLAVMVMFVAGQASAGYKVVVNASNPASSLTRKQAAAIFMKKASKWEHGTPAVAVDQVAAANARETFSKEVLGKSVSAVKSYWQQQIFAGAEVPPVEKSSDDEVIAFVKSNPGAIGYVSDTSAAAGVKTLRVE